VANALPTDVRFVIVAVGGAVSTGQEGVCDKLTGYDVCVRTSMALADITAQLRAAGPSGFDPRSSLEALAQPTLFLYGSNDMSHPTDPGVFQAVASWRATLPR
jgi:pimeloyl-ACP methyl ester carboxylesterase